MFSCVRYNTEPCLLCRVKHEEMHVLNQIRNGTHYNFESTFLSFELTTTFCIYIHGGLMIALLLFTLFR